MNVTITLDRLKVDGETYKPNGVEFDCHVFVQVNVPDEFVVKFDNSGVTVTPEGAYHIAKTLREAQDKIFRPSINPNEFSSIFGDDK